MSNDYIRTAAPVYPEMHLCYSPVYDNPLNVGPNNLLTNSPRTMRTGFRSRKKEVTSPVHPAAQTALPDDSTLTSMENNPASEDGSNGVFSNSPLETSIYSPIDPSLHSSGDSNRKSSDLNHPQALVSADLASRRKARRRSTLEAQQQPVHFDQPQPSISPAAEKPLTSLSLVDIPDTTTPLTFDRKPLPTSPTLSTRQSTLSAMIAEKGKAAENPFAEDYSFVSGKGETSPTTLCVYLPFCSEPDKPVNVIVRSDALVEEVIGFLLYQYIEQKKTPKLDPDMCNVVRWVLRIAEEDGEIEEDLPAVDRARRINRISFDQFALCEATPSQVKQNEQTHAKLAKNRPKKEPALNAGRTLEPSMAQIDQPDTIAITSNLTDGLTNGQLKQANPQATSSNEQVSSANVAVPVPSQKNMLTKSTMTMAPTQHFRIKLMTNEEVSATTTLPVHAQMFMGDVLELVCRKRKLDSNEYILTFADFNMIVPNDTTVESLNGIVDLCLIKRSAAAGLHVANSSHLWRSPNKKKKEDLYPAALFSPNSSNPSVNENSIVLAIDGDYVHIMPPEKTGMFDSVKTTSFHISSVTSCKQSKKAPSNFKISVVKDRDHDHKTYELEAESAKDARKLNWVEEYNIE
ncbi:stress-activated map kinase interacting protein 1-domain-containing protein [Umbelopsis sp. PMI_123]|nr:stress-activated map kinase interacting protein 1-domain-containing protein [Umbelopsis sp. PMI_123]